MYLAGRISCADGYNPCDSVSQWVLDLHSISPLTFHPLSTFHQSEIAVPHAMAEVTALAPGLVCLTGLSTPHRVEATQIHAWNAFTKPPGIRIHIC
jgi:hypothetical protein